MHNIYIYIHIERYIDTPINHTNNSINKEVGHK